ncbi:hypothetical protein [Bradyrhizobium sp. LVM 105]|uniref:hypothetical protein n=1 Tax=Bradyrhizobium sp. LVM 105 TaxID=2341115 RepID=UPI000F80E183|nr:hypothetical protein [Bradyrhizobium sp. LVM 105]
MTDIRRPRAPLGVRLGHTRAAPGQDFLIAAYRNGYRLMFGLSTRDQDALSRKFSNENFVDKSLNVKPDSLALDQFAHSVDLRVFVGFRNRVRPYKKSLSRNGFCDSNIKTRSRD